MFITVKLWNPVLLLFFRAIICRSLAMITVMYESYSMIVVCDKEVSQ